ncbi:hypothetical protein DFJ43DRAFT_795737 [Lentinula guzmanii]|uniref:Uncharacterized protein n=1 Tax=Lentinula guzmanii TaxID=2804957 RepID=A0AA38JA30_9AGAR|nr:hypothetical protein DFJ43DRAFT_795737 [Lentinula guzmanii]
MAFLWGKDSFFCSTTVTCALCVQSSYTSPTTDLFTMFHVWYIGVGRSSITSLIGQEISVQTPMVRNPFRLQSNHFHHTPMSLGLNVLGDSIAFTSPLSQGGFVACRQTEKDKTFFGGSPV